MAYVKLPFALSWSNIYTLSGVTLGKSLVVTNYWTKSVTIVESATEPNLTTSGYPLMPGCTVSLSYKGLPFWVKGEDGYISVDEINKQQF